MENENPFKKLGIPPQEVPIELKKKVMDEVNAIKLFMEVAGLFSSNYAQTLESFFKTKNNSNQSKKDNNHGNS